MQGKVAMLACLLFLGSVDVLNIFRHEGEVTKGVQVM